MDPKTKNKYSYSPSVNIIRDNDAHLNYIPTYNSSIVYNEIVNASQLGIRSFSIAGAYGTGKSSFLWALGKDLRQTSSYFSGQKKLMPEYESFEIVDFVGEFKSVRECFSSAFKAKPDILINSLQSYAASLKANNRGLVLRIDEFGKFLEYASQNEPEREIYFLQQLAELANDANQNILLLTTLHQDFSAYAYKLEKSLKNEWDKVKGRFKEVTFNEPVEQLLLLAAERISHHDFGFPNAKAQSLIDAIEKSQAFPLRNFFNLEIARKLLPLDILAASVLTMSLQKYGQNERSLFSFIEANDYLGLQNFIEKGSFPLYNLVAVHDYLIHHFYHFLTTKYNPDYAKWSAIQIAVERAEGTFDDHVVTSVYLVKIIGMLNIFCKGSAKISRGFLKKYTSVTLGVNDFELAIKQLELFKVVRYIKYLDSYKLFEGTDVDIELAIDNAGKIVEQVRDLSKHLNEVFDLPYVPAKKFQYETGTPRYFEYRITEEPIDEIPKGEIDGYINLLFSSSINSQKLEAHSSHCKEAILFVWFKNTKRIRELVTEIEKAKKAKQDNIEDRVARREFESIITHQEKLLSHFVLDKMHSQADEVEFYFGGRQILLSDKKSFNQMLSKICYEIYPNTPVYLNEMVNKTKLSSQISSARKNLIIKLIENCKEESLGFLDTQYPPEKTIYQSLIKKTSIHRKIEGNFTLGEPLDKSFKPIWETSIEFLNECKQSKKPLNELVDRFGRRPIKMKNGFVDFWLPIFLIIKKDDYALFGKEGFIPFINPDTLELIIKKPGDYEIKAFDVEGIKLEVFNKYREFINQANTQKAGNESFIETIKPFLAFYRGLPEYAKNTKSISKQALKLRAAIAQSKDPEKAFFEEFPQALGYSLNELNTDTSRLQHYFDELQHSIKQIRTSYQQLLERFEGFVLEEIVGSSLEFEKWKPLLTKRFESIKSYRLQPHQKTFLQRVNSPLDDKKAWMRSVAQAVLGKPLEQIEDDEEFKLYDRFKEIVHELDNLSELAKEGVDEERENVFKLEITSFLDGVQNRLVRLPKSKIGKSEEIEEKVKSVLSSDKNLNIYILTELLKELLKNNEQ